MGLKLYLGLLEGGMSFPRYRRNRFTTPEMNRTRPKQIAVSICTSNFAWARRYARINIHGCSYTEMEGSSSICSRIVDPSSDCSSHASWSTSSPRASSYAFRCHSGHPMRILRGVFLGLPVIPNPKATLSDHCFVLQDFNILYNNTWKTWGMFTIYNVMSPCSVLRPVSTEITRQHSAEQGREAPDVKTEPFSGPLNPQIWSLSRWWNWSKNSEKWPFSGPLNPQIWSLSRWWNWSKNSEKCPFSGPSIRRYEA